MITLFRWALVGMGIVYLFSQSAIMASFRARFHARPFLRSLIYCPACLGFWVGLAMGPYWPWHFESPYRAFPESGIALMCLGAVWAAIWGNPAYANEVDSGSPTPAEASEDERRDAGTDG